MATGYFLYSKEEGESIIISDTLFDQGSAQTTYANTMLFELKKLSEKDLKLQLHMTTLSDYWREKMIPRGLGIKKILYFGAEDSEFKDKWEAILNKCSLLNNEKPGSPPEKAPISVDIVITAVI